MNQSENPAPEADQTPVETPDADPVTAETATAETATAETATAETATADDDSRLFPRVTAYRFRRGTMRPGQQRNWDEHWPTYGQNVSDTVVDPVELFGRTAPLVVEIGSGTGTSTAAMAAVEPDLDVIAVEVYQPGLAQLLGMILRSELTNVRMIRGDGVDVLTNMIAPASLTGVRVFFPDPWPKARHHKRRLLQPGTFGLIASRLKPGGVLHVATDHADYAEWIDETGDAEPMLERLDATTDVGHVPFSLERPVTKFEGKGLDEERVINEFLWRRKS
ncbi:tRNA (guanosine(46)-N7)-methyltransferase TrmB [Dietzia aerolata]|uniref:tRNA (guanine-N(7)-)-methyltransferase n=2 Tax=Dietzia aerolata TaxID=595984 RepID=A0ABV5JUD6_9ACTN